jgi:hypothetical protein
MNLLPTLLSATLACSAGTPSPATADSSYRALFEKGVTFEQFLNTAERRKEQWTKNYGQAVVPDALLTRARAATGTWKLLVVAVDGCSDSVNTIPYLARLTEQLMGVELRIIDNKLGEAIMNAHKTPDGRGATPTVLLLDGDFNERGCWVERPAALLQWMADQKGKVKDDDIFSGKMGWYDEDKGANTLSDFVAVLEGAARGAPVCTSGKQG